MDPLFPPPPFSLHPPSGGAPQATAPEPPQNHAAASPALSQPPYADMIYGAITALKERDGSSKRAITKYIEKEYPGMLPDGYAEMLTQHLKRLKNSGLLVLNKKSYMLPSTRSEPVAAANPLPVGPAAANGSYPVISPAEIGFFQGLQQQHPELMFPLGIPPNLFTNPFQQQFAAPARAPAPLPVAEDSSVGVKRGRGRPPKPKNDVKVLQDVDGVGSEVNDAAQPVFVALGLADDPAKVAKRRPGRPKKYVVAGEDGGAVAPVTEAMPQQQVMKRGRGRPPRIEAGKMGGPEKPELNTDVDPALLNNVPPKPRGRPRKFVVVPGVGGKMAMKRMGRPPNAFAGVNRLRTRSGRPVGRPRKYPLPANGAHRSGPQSEGYEDMRRKLEFFQSRIMHAVQVLKPEFRNESSHDAIKAIQELEGLASVDISTPFIEDLQPPAAAAPPPPQQS